MVQLDQPGFTQDTRPNLYPSPSYGTAYKQARRVDFAPQKDIEPGRDARYSAYAAPMSDGRLVTDYRPQCSKNIPSYAQYTTKQWMVNHTDQIIQESRKRQVEWSGASLPLANTVPPPANIVHSNPFYSEVDSSGVNGGIGVERANSKAPQLFGTFTYEPTMNEIRNNRKNISLTKYYEGGRNSPRGVFPQ
jgi:hypothetical protein